MDKFKIIAESWGGTRRDYMTGLSHEEALDVCEDMNWQLDTGYIWDLVIEEDDLQ